MTKCITFPVVLIINVYLTEIPHKYALRTYFSYCLRKRALSNTNDSGTVRVSFHLKIKWLPLLGIEHCDWFIFPLLLPTPTMQFSVDHKRRSHKRNRYSASDSDSLIFTRSHRSALVITTPTPPLVKISLQSQICSFQDRTQKLLKRVFVTGVPLPGTACLARLKQGTSSNNFQVH